jgi:hypothetical protein
MFMVGRKKPIDYASFAAKCPEAIRACRETAVWLTHSLFLGTTDLVDQLADAFLKVRQNYRELL